MSAQICLKENSDFLKEISQKKKKKNTDVNQPPGRHTCGLNLKFLRLCLNYRTHQLQPLTAEGKKYSQG